RSDWCISRQRTWGVPIPIFYCKECGKEIITDETIKHIQELFRQYGSNIWFEKEASELIPEGLTCECGCHEFRKETDIMDVWFDSGSSHLAVLAEGNFPGQQWPADLYLEGSDQHRGWFNSSLNVAVAVKGSAPYKAVLTHGFIVDEKGKKMSKSLGNALDPHEIIDKMGADVLRLWVASADYRSDLSISNKILKQVAESYRKIRNTSRFLLSNLYDFDPKKDCVDYKDMPEVDRWMMHRLQVLIDKVLNGYEEYEFHVVYHAIHKFCVVEMSNLYLDITKDTLYSELPEDLRRRSVQTVMYHIIDALVRLLAPVLAYTTEEIYDFMPKAEEAAASVQLLDMPKANPEYMDEALDAKWQAIAAVKDVVAKSLEDARKAKAIGNSIDAKVDLYSEGEQYDLLKSAEALLAYFFKVSQFELHEGLDGKTAEEGVAVEVSAAKGHKCERCWLYTEDVDAENPDLCPRCGAVMKDIHADAE
ncbi:MAG: class I tRNA ligase family protein, partial [Bacillota bacterium]